MNGVTPHVVAAGLALCDHGALQIVEGASHGLHIERPERVDARILAFPGEGR